MAEKQVIKVSEEELKKIRDLRQSYQDITYQLGQTEFQITDLTKILKDLTEAKNKVISQYDELKKLERTHFEELNKKYGMGSLDVETGLFTPIENKG